MNANELADKLAKEWVLHDKNVGFLMKTSAEFLYTQITMLRQQAEEIIELECEKERQREKYEGMLCDKDVEIEALKAGKIRAYDNGVEDGKKPNTHPAKTLTDEEIEECFEESCTDFKLLENGKTKGVVNIIDVGRAILKKAQEK